MESSTTPRIGSRYGIADREGPETIRMRKYATGTHVLLEELAVDIGATPREVVWAENKARLYRYGSAGDERRAVPLLLVQEGFDVYLLDFGVSGREDAGLGLDDVISGGFAGRLTKSPARFSRSSSARGHRGVRARLCASPA